MFWLLRDIKSRFLMSPIIDQLPKDFNDESEISDEVIIVDGDDDVVNENLTEEHPILEGAVKKRKVLNWTVEEDTKIFKLQPEHGNKYVDYFISYFFL